MEIKYTYQEPNDRPIGKARFQTEYGFLSGVTLRGAFITLEVEGKHVNFSINDFADFTKLINRINKQIGNEG
jgi:predicted ester cyclase